MVPHRSLSNSTLPILGLALVLAVTLSSCGRGADSPPASNRAAADTAAPAPAPPAPPAPPPRELTWSRKVDMQLWSPGRVKAYQAALERETPPTLAILRIPSIKLEVPVYDGTTDAVLDLAAGRIEYTALPGTVGNVGIAAHRDSFFRGLKDIREDDTIALTTLDGTFRYKVEWTKIVKPADVSVLEPTDEPALTLVTCYPFYYVGSAPERFIVRAYRIPEKEEPAEWIVDVDTE